MATKEEMDNFLKEFRKDPNLLSKIQAKEGMNEFKEKYNVEKATPLRCPICNQYGVTGGSLWISKDTSSSFTCRKCHITFIITTSPVPIEEIPDLLRRMNKESILPTKIIEEYSKDHGN